MQVQLEDALRHADRSEAAPEGRGVSIPARAFTGADMLPPRHVPRRLSKGFSGIPDGLRNKYSTGVAVHDLAVKVPAVEEPPNFDMPNLHLQMLTQEAAHLAQEPAGNADACSKPIETCRACLPEHAAEPEVRVSEKRNPIFRKRHALMANGVEIELDPRALHILRT